MFSPNEAGIRSRIEERLRSERIATIRSLAMQRLAHRRLPLTCLNTPVAAQAAIAHATRIYDAVMAIEVPDA